MAAIPQINITAPKRVPFDDTIPTMLRDYSGASATMEIRVEDGGQGAPLASLGASSNGGEGIAITYDASFADPETGEPDGATVLQIIINETTLEGLAYGADPAQNVNLRYDIHLDPVGGKKFIYAAGDFIVTPGTTL